MRDPLPWSRVLRSLRAVFLPLSTLSLVTCTEDPVGPGGRGARLSLTPVFGPYARVAPLVIDRVGIIVARSIPVQEISETVFADTVPFPADRDRLRIDDITVQMDQSSEDLEVTIQLISTDILLFSGTQTVTVVRGGRTSDLQIPVTYFGPGNQLATLQLGPRDTVVQPRAEVDFRVDGFDANNGVVPQYYVGWSLTSGAANSASIDALGHLTASSVNDTFYVKVAAPNGVLDSTRVLVASTTTQPGATLVWTGAVSTDFSVAGNWNPAQVPAFLDSLIIGATPSQRQPSLSAQSVVGSVNIIAGGNLTVAGQALGMIRGLTTGGSGVLTMIDPADIVSVQGDALFDGGNELGLMSAGALTLAGNLTQRATNSGDSFHPSGTHITILAGATPTLSFATPGLVQGTSHFQQLGWIGTGTLTLATPVLAHDEMVITTQGNSIIASSNGSRLTVADLVSVGSVALNNVPLTLQQDTPGSLGLSNIIFQNMPTTVSQLVVTHPGGNFIFSNLTFSTTPVAPNGFYLDVNDPTGPTDGGLVINMDTPTPASGGAFVRVSNGAVVNWPAGTTTTRVWSGATSRDWGTTGNWVGGVVPGATDSAVILTGPNSPLLGADVQVGAVNVNGGTLTLGGHTMTVTRTFATSGSGTLTMTNPLDGLTVGGNAVFGGGSTTGLLTDGTISAGGNFTQLSGTSPLSFAAGALHRVRFENPGPVITFATPGLTSSRFGILEEGNGNNGFSLGSDIAVSGDLEGPDGLTGQIIGNNMALTLTQGIGCCVNLDGVRLIIDDPTGQSGGMNGVTFINLPTSATQLTLRHPGLGSFSFSISSVIWQPLTTGNTGAYVDATDLNGATGGILTVRISGGDPGNGPAFTRTASAGVIWPNQAFVWTGLGPNGTGWKEPRNWSTLLMPGQLDSVVIPQVSTNPAVLDTTGTVIGSLTIQTAGTLNLGTNLLVLWGSLHSGNNIITGTGAGGLTLTGATVGSALDGGAGTNVLITGSYVQTRSVTIGGTLAVSGALNLSGHSLRVTNLSTTGATSILQMQNPLDSLIVSGVASFAGGNQVGQFTAGVLVVNGNFAQTGGVQSFAASGSHKTVFGGDPGQTIVFLSQDGAARFQDVDFACANCGAVGGGTTLGSRVVIGGNARLVQPIGPGTLLDLGGHTLQINGNYTNQSGELRMTNPADSLIVGGNGTFFFFSTLSAGVVRVLGNFTAGNSLGYSPSGTHVTALGGGAGPSVIAFDLAGSGAAGNHFQILDLTPAVNGVLLGGTSATNFVDSILVSSPGANVPEISPQAGAPNLTVRSVNVTGLTLTNVRLIINEGATPLIQKFDNVLFRGFPVGNTTQLRINANGGAAAPRPITFDNTTFSHLATAGVGDFYVQAATTNGFGFNLTFSNASESPRVGGNGPAFSQFANPVNVTFP